MKKVPPPTSPKANVAHFSLREKCYPHPRKLFKAGQVIALLEEHNAPNDGFSKSFIRGDVVRTNLVGQGLVPPAPIAAFAVGEGLAPIDGNLRTFG